MFSGNYDRFRYIWSSSHAGISAKSRVHVGGAHFEILQTVGLRFTGYGYFEKYASVFRDIFKPAQ